MAYDPAEDLLSALRAMTRPSQPTQAARLFEFWERRNINHNLRPGQLVQEKPGMGKFKPESRKVCVLLLWKVFPPAGSMEDCTVAWLDDNAKELMFINHELCQLMPFEPEKRTKVDENGQ